MIRPEPEAPARNRLSLAGLTEGWSDLGLKSLAGASGSGPSLGLVSAGALSRASFLRPRWSGRGAAGEAAVELPAGRVVPGERLLGQAGPHHLDGNAVFLQDGVVEGTAGHLARSDQLLVQ